MKSSVALAHHWLVTDRGGEKVLGELRRIFPHAPIATLVLRRGEIPDWVIGNEVVTSWLQRLPLASRFYKQMLPLHPAAISRLKVPEGTRLVISSDASMIKGLRLPSGCEQVCYCHSPPRYLWDMADQYLESASVSRIGALAFSMTRRFARRFDNRSARNVDHFIANSQFVASRINKFYGRIADVIYPPVDLSRFSFERDFSDFYLIVSQLVPYKRVDVAVRACTLMDRRLVVIGEGSEMAALKAIAGPTIEFLGRQDFSVVKRHFETCRAFLNPQIEDFGITAVEAQAAGRPVIALRDGGALEIVCDMRTGVFFDEQKVDSLIDAIGRFESIRCDWRLHCRENAMRFSAERFRREMARFLSTRYPWLGL